MKKYYISPELLLIEAEPARICAGSGTKGNWGKGNYDNEGSEKDEPVPDDPGEIDSDAKIGGDDDDAWQSWDE